MDSIHAWLTRPRRAVYPCHMAPGDKFIVDGKERMATHYTVIANLDEGVTFVNGKDQDNG